MHDKGKLASVLLTGHSCSVDLERQTPCDFTVTLAAVWKLPHAGFSLICLTAGVLEDQVQCHSYALDDTPSASLIVFQYEAP